MTERFFRIDPKIVPDGGVTKECFAVVKVSRRARKRFPIDCVRVVQSAVEARRQADPDQGWRAAEVMGPSRSSEGVQVYYLVRWLD